jgi:hypothetical protein
MHFMAEIRHKDAFKMQDMLAAGKSLPTNPTDPLSLGFDDRLHFSHYVVIEKDWNRALAYQAILVIRSVGNVPGSEKIRERFESLLRTDDATVFWTTFIPARELNLSVEQSTARTPFGYLEGKFDDVLPIETFRSIEVPSEMLSTVRSWPEAKPYFRLIREKAPVVP